MTQVEWDYSDRAATYDDRADYSAEGLDWIVSAANLAEGSTVVDVGAGTGKLALPLADRGLTVKAVEPNDNMRAKGIENTGDRKIMWSDGTGENTGVDSAVADAVTFGSSFNVVDQQAALKESARLLGDAGAFVCLWNHRDLDDPLQQKVEGLFKDAIDGYDYGKRRQDPTGVIAESGLFKPADAREFQFVADIPKDTWVAAWRSHATLARQAGDKFEGLVTQIEEMVAGQDVLQVPYVTRIWAAHLA